MVFASALLIDDGIKINRDERRNFPVRGRQPLSSDPVTTSGGIRQTATAEADWHNAWNPVGVNRNEISDVTALERRRIAC